MGNRERQSMVSNRASVKVKFGYVKSLTTKKQTTKFSSANFKKMLNPNYNILRIQRLECK